MTGNAINNANNTNQINNTDEEQAQLNNLFIGSVLQEMKSCSIAPKFCGKIKARMGDIKYFKTIKQDILKEDESDDVLEIVEAAEADIDTQSTN